MNIGTRALILAASMTVSFAAVADSSTPGFYVGGVYTGATIDLDDVDKDADVGAMFARGGYQINQNFAIEARLGTGVDDDKVHGVKVELEDVYGAYLKAGLPTSFGLYPYAMLGMTHAEIKASWHGGHVSDSDSDVSYGVGADYWFNSTVSAGLEFANFYDKNGDDISGVTFGMNIKF